MAPFVPRRLGVPVWSQVQLLDWPTALDGSNEISDGKTRISDGKTRTAEAPLNPIQPVWQLVISPSGSRAEDQRATAHLHTLAGMPDYDACFQGLC